MGLNPRQKKEKSGRIVYEELDLKQAIERSNIKSRKYKIKKPGSRISYPIYIALLILFVIAPIIMIFFIGWAGSK